MFVTGAGTGLGKAIASEFARLGAAIVIASRKDEHLDAGRAAIEAIGAPRARGRSATSASPTASPPPSTRAEAAFGLPDVLVNNAAANFPVPAEDMSPNAWRTVVDITLNGTFICAREFGRRHLVAGTPGSIINVGASYAWTGGPGFVHSAAAKAGVKNLTESLAVEWGPYGIQVNGLVPGLFPHEDMTSDIRGNIDRTHDKDRVPARVARRGAPGARLGRDVPRLAVRAVHLRAHAGGRRGELATSLADEPGGRDRARPDGPRALRPGPEGLSSLVAANEPLAAATGLKCTAVDSHRVDAVEPSS